MTKKKTELTAFDEAVAAMIEIPRLVAAHMAENHGALRKAAGAGLLSLLAEEHGLPEKCPDPSCRRGGECRAEFAQEGHPRCGDLWTETMATGLLGGLVGIDFALVVIDKYHQRRILALEKEISAATGWPLPAPGAPA